MLHLYNTLTLQKEPFNGDERQVGVYVCGFTPIDETDLGQAFTNVHFDVLVRYLRHLGRRVVNVQSLIDIDEHLFETARALDSDWQELCERNTYRFLSDMHWLGNLAPTMFPRATEMIPAMIEHIEKLLKRGWAYHENGNIYFDFASCESFGCLSRHPREQWLSAANRDGMDPNDPRNKNQVDFILWRQSDEPNWDSPWGKGRPGRQSQCASIAMKLLGPTIDIHGGSADAAFPHHHSSAAQSECVTGETFSRYWLHTARVDPDKLFLHDLRSWGGNTLRIGILDHHYAVPWMFDQGDMRKAKETEELFRQAWLRRDGRGSAVDPQPWEHRFFAALNDDLNTPLALNTLRQTALSIMRDSNNAAGGAKAFLARGLRLLGLAVDPELDTEKRTAPVTNSAAEN